MAITDSRETIIAKRKYSETIKGSQYDLYLSNYPSSADYLAIRIGDSEKTLAELCCGIGITTERMARVFKKITAIELNNETIACCRENIRKAGLLDKVTLLQGDVADSSTLKGVSADIVIYDIPYWVSKTLEDGTDILTKNPKLVDVVNSIKRTITDDIVIFAPPSLTHQDAKDLLGEHEYERITINGRYDRNYIYLGGLIRRLGITNMKLHF